MPPKKPSTIWTSDGLPEGIKCQLCVIQAGQTGDVPHVAAAAALDDYTDVLVISSDKENLCSDLREYFTSVTRHKKEIANRNRVQFIALSPLPIFQKGRDMILYNMLVSDQKGQRVGQNEVQDLINFSKDDVVRLLESDQTKEKMRSLLQWRVEFPEKVGTYESFGPSAATRLVAQVWENTKLSRFGLYTKLASRLSYDPTLLPIDQIISRAEAAGMNFPPVVGTGPIILLWARYSGSMTTTGYNPEGDSDVEGQRQLHAMLSRLFPTSAVITIGHDPSGKHLPRNQAGYHSTHHLGEDFFTKGPIKDRGRGGQLSFFLALMQRYPGRLYQIGQKTGAMDAAALVGIPTVYIEDGESPSLRRMENWTTSVPFFQCAQIKEPPTVLGKAIRSLEREIKAIKDAKVEGAKGLPTFRQLNPDTPMPRDQWRRIAMLYQGLINLSPNVRVNWSDPETIVDACLTANNATLKTWDEDIEKLTPNQLKESKKTKLFQGYSEADLEIIKTKFAAVVTSYNRPDTVIRDVTGNYIARGP